MGVYGEQVRSLALIIRNGVAGIIEVGHYLRGAVIRYLVVQPANVSNQVAQAWFPPVTNVCGGHA
jgi:hypothetical protein